jgi:hypothetical protein
MLRLGANGTISGTEEEGEEGESAVEEATRGGKIIYYRARGARAKGMSNMTTLNKTVIEQQQHDSPEPTCTDLKFGNNGTAILN